MPASRPAVRVASWSVGSDSALSMAARSCWSRSWFVVFIVVMPWVVGGVGLVLSLQLFKVGLLPVKISLKMAENPENGWVGRIIEELGKLFILS